MAFLNASSRLEPEEASTKSGQDYGLTPFLGPHVLRVPRKLRVEFPGAIYHVMSRGDRREDIFKDDVDRQDFLKTLAEANVDCAEKPQRLENPRSKTPSKHSRRKSKSFLGDSGAKFFRSVLPRFLCFSKTGGFSAESML